jgi:sulfur-carrier protein
MPLDLLYFGALRDSMGRDGERVDPPSHVVTVGDLVAWLAAKGGAYASALGDPARIHAAVEAEPAEQGGSIFGAREVALFPPPGAL